MLNYFRKLNEYFADLLENYNTERARIKKFNYSSEYSLYKNCNDSLRQLEHQLNSCFQEICEVKHILKCTKDDNVRHAEELKFIKKHFEKNQGELLGYNSSIDNNIYTENILKPSLLQNFSFEVPKTQMIYR